MLYEVDLKIVITTKEKMLPSYITLLCEKAMRTESEFEILHVVDSSITPNEIDRKFLEE